MNACKKIGRKRLVLLASDVVARMEPRSVGRLGVIGRTVLARLASPELKNRDLRSWAHRVGASATKGWKPKAARSRAWLAKHTRVVQ